MNQGKVDWKGSYVAIVTPFTASGEIDRRAFTENIEFLLAAGAHGLVVSGCTGESWALSAEERIELFRLAADVAGRRVPVIAGTGGIGTDAVISLSLRAKEVGASGVMVLPPYYAMPGRHEVVGHFSAISHAVGAPILLYNIPRRTGINLTPDVLQELVELEWVVAIKESSNDFIQLESTIRTVGERINVFSGHSAERGVPALLMGAKGFVSSMESQVMGREAVAMYELVRSGRLEEARTTQLKTLALDEAMRKIGTFPANLKAAMNLLGRRGGFPRRPLLPLGEADVARVGQVLADLDVGARAA
jgi:4-hydroxy-tetrahydrodipicolinate synthase